MLGKLNRYCGADFSLFPSPYGSVALPKESALAIHDECVKDDVFHPSFAVPSAGIHPGMVPLLMRDFGIDHIINAGGGIHGHPKGAEGGEKRSAPSLMRCLKRSRLKKSRVVQRSSARIRQMGKGGSRMTRTPLIICDFDGTVTMNDNIVSMMKEFAPPEWLELKDGVLSKAYQSKKESAGCSDCCRAA